MNFKSRLFIIISMVIFGTIGVFRRNIAVSSGELALLRAVMAVGVIIVFMILSGKKIDFAVIKRALPWLNVSGIAMGFNWILLFEAYNYTTVSAATLSYYFAPVLGTVASVFLLKEKVSKKQIICFLGATFGIIMITGVGEVSSGNKHFYGILLGLSAAVLYASVVLLNKRIKDVDGITRTLFQFIAAVVVLLPYVLLSNGINLSVLDKTGVWSIVTLGVIHTGLAYCMYFSALKNLDGQEAAILSYVDPLVAVVLSLTVLNEKMGIMQIIGGIMILTFTLLNEIKIGKKE